MTHQIKRSLLLKSDINSVWDFTSNPYNLKKITPDFMNFKIINTELSTKIYEGMILKYKVSPILKIPITWVTEITHVKEKISFIDEQRFGPYKIWHHEHLFQEHEDGVKMKDIVTYVPPFHMIGKVVNTLYLTRKLNQIFDYREMKINHFFNKKQTTL